MIKAVIFDWIGTLYERNKGLYPDTLSTLNNLHEKGIRMSLISLSKENESRRQEIDNSGLTRFLNPSIITKSKTHQEYLACMHLMSSDNSSTLIVDDRTKRGIQIGNDLRCSTAWIKRGDYACELPDDQTGFPTYIISTVSDILHIVLDIKSRV